MNQKLYPFSLRRDGYAIEYAIDEIDIKLIAIESGDAPHDPDEWEKLNHHHDKLTDLLAAIYSTADHMGVAWLTGAQIGLAKEAIKHVARIRAHRRINKPIIV
jgi:hypothetical protein